MRGRIAALSLLLAAGAAGVAPGRATDPPGAAPALRAGAAVSNITPPLGVSINGGFQDVRAEHVHDDLHVRCLVLDDGGIRLAIAVVDACMVPDSVIAAARRLLREETGLPESNLLISATHSHSCGTLAPVFQSDPSPNYPGFVARRIADGVLRALNNLAPAQVGWGSGNLPDEVFNRRWRMREGAIPPNPFGVVDRVRMNPPPGDPNLVEPAGPTDPELPVLSVVTPAGRPVALLANYALHYVGGVGPGHVSADYFGVFADRVQQLLGADRQSPPFVGMMTNGASGDVNNINFRTPGPALPPYEKMRQVAYRVAAEALRTQQGIRHRTDVSLAAAETVLRLGVRKGSPADLARAREIVAGAGSTPLRTAEQVFARETLLLDEYPDQVSITLQALRVGDLVLYAIPCEVFVQIGLDLKQRSPLRPAVIISLANGYHGYLPTPEHHQLGGYETWRARSSYLEAGASPRIVAALVRLAGELSK
jgi:neutral ceramidase